MREYLSKMKQYRKETTTYEKGAMKLVYGSLIRTARDWQRVGIDRLELTE